jgi:hypothetical protein
VALKQHAWTRVTRADSGTLLISIKMTIHDPASSSLGGETCWLKISPARNHATGPAAMPAVTHSPSVMLSAYFFISKMQLDSNAARRD